MRLISYWKRSIFSSLNVVTRPFCEERHHVTTSIEIGMPLDWQVSIGPIDQCELNTLNTALLELLSYNL